MYISELAIITQVANDVTHGINIIFGERDEIEIGDIRPRPAAEQKEAFCGGGTAGGGGINSRM
ncbi:unnamed protein product [Coffea canephora]|uniref:Uncharacterized protein n=1 Tax=Coffea canephora TaxID=49390 RepID=A0A068V637_COFCA|nr:unnamed protein product [Coffea canephora]